MSNDLRALATLAVVALLTLAMMIFGSVGPDIRPNVVSGLFTLAAAAVAATVVFWQLRKQAENAAKSNQQNEALKLKKEIYEEVWKRIDQARAALNALSVHLTGVQDVAVRFLEHDAQMPGASLDRPTFDASSRAANTACLELIRIADTWMVADARLRIFSLSFNELYEHGKYIALDYRSDTAIPLGNHDVVGVSFRSPSENPEAEALDDLIFLIARWLDVIDMWESCIDDYQRAMQQVLLSDLFTLHIERSSFKQTERQRLRTLRLDDYDNLIGAIENRAISTQLREMDMQRRRPQPGRAIRV